MSQFSYIHIPMWKYFSPYLSKFSKYLFLRMIKNQVSDYWLSHNPHHPSQGCNLTLCLWKINLKWLTRGPFLVTVTFKIVYTYYLSNFTNFSPLPSLNNNNLIHFFWFFILMPSVIYKNMVSNTYKKNVCSAYTVSANTLCSFSCWRAQKH